MFISKRELYSLKETIKHLEHRLDNERDKRWEIEGHLNDLLKHLNLEIVHIPPTRVIKERK